MIWSSSDGSLNVVLTDVSAVYACDPAEQTAGWQVVFRGDSEPLDIVVENARQLIEALKRLQ